MGVTSRCYGLVNRWDRVFSHQLAGRTKVGHWNRLPPSHLRNVRAPDRLLRLDISSRDRSPSVHLLRGSGHRETSRLEVW